MIKKFTFILFVSILLSSCVTQLNRNNAASHANAAYSAQQRGDWDTARRQYAKAVVNAELGGESPQMISILNFEYGRSTGVTCFYNISEEYLSKALKMDQQYNGPVHMDLLELARLNYDQDKFVESIKYFDQLLPIYKKNNAEKLDPIGVANAYEEYAISLESVGKPNEASSFKQRAETLRSNNIGENSPSERTPYGTQCVTQ